MVLIIAVIGTSGSGKTTTIEYLISQLTNEGYKVGAIKHIFHKGVQFDKEGTNTWRFAKAGSKVTVAVSAEEMVIIKKTKSALSDLNQIIKLLEKEKLDVIFIEGFHSLTAKRKDILKIITAKDADNLKRTLEETAQPILAITGEVVQNRTKTNELKIPFIDMPSEGKQLLKFIKKYLEKPQG
jgi:molybdopterin-guanine dinucleotide biosynthesis protein B